MEAIKDYVAHLDNKKRITLRGAAYQYYNVKEYGNGCIILEPRELAVPESISARTLADMAQEADIQRHHLAEALGYRAMDRLLKRLRVP